MTGTISAFDNPNGAVTQFLSLSIALKLQCNILKNVKTINIPATPLKTISVPIRC